MNDSISRQAAIDAIFSEPLYESGMKKRDADAVVPAIYEKIKSLPSAQPQRKRGEWVPGKEIAREFLAGNVFHVDYLNYRCSVCGAIVGERETIMYHFCPNCGAKMEADEP